MKLWSDHNQIIKPPTTFKEQVELLRSRKIQVYFSCLASIWGNILCFFPYL